MTVLLTDLRTVEAQDIRNFLIGRGDDVVTLPDEGMRADEAALKAFLEPYAQSLDAVIHPAPPLFLKPFEEAGEDDFVRAATDGPIVAWCVTKVCAALMKKRGGGVIIYLNSVHAEKPVGRGFLFSAGCGAVQMLAREANQDYSADGIRTYFIQRGITDADPDGRSDVSSVYFGVDQRYPARKMPERGWLNGMVAFLLSDGAAPLSGSDLRADGGMTMYYGQYGHEKVGEAHGR